MRTLVRHPYHAAILIALASAAWAAAPEAVEPPPNAPATVEWNAQAGRLSLRYHGSVILDATVGSEDTAGHAVAGGEIRLEPTETLGEKVEQRLKFVAAKPQDGTKLVLRGTVTGGEEAFPAETQGEAQRRFPLVRTSVGLSHSLRNNALYDRRWDWVLVGPGDGATHIQPKAADAQCVTFTWESRGAAIELVFRPRFYQKHRELAFFEPWTYRVWKGPVTGYCTWWAYRDGINQQTLDAVVDVFATKKLPEFGYKYIQIDAGYCGGAGGPRSFLEWDTKKYPGGTEYAVKKIKSAGMQGGIWVHRVYRSYVDRYLPEIGKQHPDWFVTKADGSIYQGGYGVWCLNTTNKDALDEMVRPLFRGIKAQGWDYVKADGAGDMLYSDKEKPAADHFKRVGISPEQSLRNWDRVAREELGPDVFILSCWGVGPGRCSIGLVDGCRLGSDGFQWRTLQANSSLNGVVWRSDPDRCDIMAEGARDKTTMRTFGAAAAMSDTIDRPCVVSMAGGMLLVSDKVEAYRDDGNLEGMKRSAPVLFTVPGQLYDGGDGTWWLQEIDRPFECWSVLARFNWRREKLKWKRPEAPEQEVKFADLGLAGDREYLVFEFWTQTFLGKCKGSFKAPAQDAGSALQVFAIREAREYPWAISTTRHISQGGVDLLDERWDAGKKVLSGKSAVVVGDPYVLTVYLPQGFRLQGAEVGGETAEIANQAETATVRVVPSATRTVEWRLAFAREAAAHDASLDGQGWEMGPFVKRDEPVLRPTPDSRFQCPVRGKEVRWEEQNVYNPAAVVRDGKVYLLYRADDKSPDLKWGRTCRIGLAHSEDGIHFARHPTPVLYPDNDEWKPYEWEGGCEDLHIIEGEDGVYYMNYTTWSGKGDSMSVATSRDLVHWTKHGPAFRKAAPDKVPGSRTGVVVSRREGDRLIAAKINGKYWMYYTHPEAVPAVVEG